MASHSTLDKEEIPSYGHQVHGQSELPDFSKSPAIPSLPLYFPATLTFPCFSILLRGSDLSHMPFPPLQW